MALTFAIRQPEEEKESSEEPDNNNNHSSLISGQHQQQRHQRKKLVGIRKTALNYNTQQHHSSSSSKLLGTPTRSVNGTDYFYPVLPSVSASSPASCDSVSVLPSPPPPSPRRIFDVQPDGSNNPVQLVVSSALNNIGFLQDQFSRFQSMILDQTNGQMDDSDSVSSCLYVTRDFVPLTQEEIIAKEDEIQACLAGRLDGADGDVFGEQVDDVDEVVDLWKLRQLSLSPGGLISPDWRKRAWPKLLACHDEVFNTTSKFINDGNSADLVEPSAEDLDSLAFYVTKTLWNVEEHLKARKEAAAAAAAGVTQKQQQQNQQRLNLDNVMDPMSKNKSPRKVTFASLAEISKSPIVLVRGETRVSEPESPEHEPVIPEENESDDEEPATSEAKPETVLKFVGASGETTKLTDHKGGAGIISREKRDDDEGHITRGGLDISGSWSPTGSGAESTSSNSSTDKEDDDDGAEANSLNTQDTPAISCSSSSSQISFATRLVRWKKPSRAEQRILYSTMVALIRTAPQESPYYEDNRYHFYKGLQDVTALLMINLESPSLTSLVLAKLAQSHLRDALRPDPSMLHMALSAAFMPLLQHVDCELYDHLQLQGLRSPSFCRQWIACWFAQDVPNSEIASRLFDAFIVSHPTFPIYTSVALLTVHRDHIFQDAGKGLSNVSFFLKHLPLRALHDDVENRAKTVEIVLSTALSYMNLMPPGDLVERLHRDHHREIEDDEQSDAISAITSDSVNTALLPAIAMLCESPEWSCEDQAPTDWALVQRRQKLARQAENPKPPQKKPPSTRNKYPLATTALGVVVEQIFEERKSIPRKELITMWLIVLPLLVFGALGTVAIYQTMEWVAVKTGSHVQLGFAPPPRVHKLLSASEMNGLQSTPSITATAPKGLKKTKTKPVQPISVKKGGKTISPVLALPASAEPSIFSPYDLATTATNTVIRQACCCGWVSTTETDHFAISVGKVTEETNEIVVKHPNPITFLFKTIRALFRAIRRKLAALFGR